MSIQSSASTLLGGPLARWLDDTYLLDHWSRKGRVIKAAEAAWFLCRCLSYDGPPSIRTELAALLQCGAVDWLSVTSLSNRHFLTPALDMGLQCKALAHLLPRDLRSYLDMISSHNRKRNGLIVTQAIPFFEALNSHGICPVLLKGGLSLFEAALHDGLFMMADLDVLLTGEEFDVGCNILRSLGYITLGNTPNYAHATTFYKAGGLATIDLHRHVGPQRRLLTAADARPSAVSLASHGLDLGGLSATHRVLLSLMNYCLFEPQYRSHELPLRGLHDLAVVCWQHRHRIDWDAITDTVRRHSLEAPARVWFNMARQLLSAPIPRTVCAASTASRRLCLCSLQLNFPRLTWPFRFGSRLAWAFGAWRIDYRYGCGLRGWPLAAARLRHATKVLLKRLHIPAASPHQGLLSR